MEDRIRRMRKACVFLISGCLNKTPHTRWLKQQQCVCPQLWMLGIHDQIAIRVGIWWGLLPCIADSCLLTASHKDSPLCSCGGTEGRQDRETETEMTASSSYKDTHPFMRGSPLWPHVILITSLNFISKAITLRVSASTIWILGGLVPAQSGVCIS